MSAEQPIVETPYNTRWWNKPFGRVSSEAFFDLSPNEQAGFLSAFDVVEYVGGTNNDSGIKQIAAAGFWSADMQIPFQLNLRAFKPEKYPSYLSTLNLVSAAENPFTLAPIDMPVFQAERFWQLSGICHDLLARRYAFWSNDLISASPDLCFQVYSSDRVIGWFLGRRIGERKVELTLAMAKSEAGPAGGFIYEAAMFAYSSMGFRLGQAAFSARNTAVMNIYSRLGARFEMPHMVWLWQRDYQDGIQSN